MTDPSIVCTCLNCASTWPAAWTSVGGKITLVFKPCNKCSSRTFKLSGGATGVISPSCVGATTSNTQALLAETESLWAAFCEQLDLHRAVMGDGSRTNMRCSACGDIMHYREGQGGQCSCRCHAAWRLRERLSKMLTPAPPPASQVPQAGALASLAPAPPKTEPSQVGELPSLPGALDGELPPVPANG